MAAREGVPSRLFGVLLSSLPNNEATLKFRSANGSSPQCDGRHRRINVIDSDLEDALVKFTLDCHKNMNHPLNCTAGFYPSENSFMFVQGFLALQL
ncbi:hypothetical protein AVEN_239759-1 [Araneus ventricosus]|uniref:Uncharacterized protein n=1 Tax=Araneus ventricosus TaxID=182803 RepID=A0A4Y2IIY3_ARAVE|nr:hypothetical protein AVEN_239759-1 [Araneus ventricosus]